MATHPSQQTASHRPLKVLVACEFSGVVRSAFRAAGHDAWSCDLLPALDGSPFHYQRDALDVIYNTWEDAATPTGIRPTRVKWDLMIAHPSCRYLTNSGVKHLYRSGKKINGRDDERWKNMVEAAEFFRRLLEAPIERTAIENPIPHGYAAELIGRGYDQIIHPWQFGHGETKATCIWRKHLPELLPTNLVPGRRPRVHHESPGMKNGLTREQRRSITFLGIAEAMAGQWGTA